MRTHGIPASVARLLTGSKFAGHLPNNLIEAIIKVA